MQNCDKTASIMISASDVGATGKNVQRN